MQLAKILDEFAGLFEDNVDNDGNDIPPVDRKIYQKGLDFFKNNFDYKIMEAPDIHLGNDGSIDISWQVKKYKLLVNVSSEKIGWYGHKLIKKRVYEDEIKGEQNSVSRNNVLYTWSKKHLVIS